MELIKSPMNYTGGKYKLLKQILPLMPEKIDGRFIDLFCGGLDVTINAPKCERVLANDIDENVTGIYIALQQHTIEEVLTHIDSRIKEYGLTKQNAEGYLKLREDYNKAEIKNYLDLYTLICYSFNNQIRFNSKGEFNLPFGHRQFNDRMRTNLIKMHERIKDIDKVLFSDYDFKAFELVVKEDDFLYCDPPYLITCATYNERDGWNEKSERDLYEMLDRLSEKGVKFALSNVMENKGRKNDILIEWAKKYNVHHLNKTYSNCSYHCIDKSTGTTDEVLITNY